MSILSAFQDAMRTTKGKLLFAGILLMLLVIWGHSLMPRSISGIESHWLVDEVLNNPEHAITFAISHDLFRKIAHIGEFLILSVLLTVFFSASVKRVGFLGFFVAFIDETLQIFSNRGPMIEDVWIDLIGIVLGFGIGVFLLWIGKSAFTNRKAQ